MNKSWKTTITGIVVLGGILISYIWPEHSGIVTTLTAAATGLGLLSARDNNVTSEQAGAKR